MSDAFRIRLQAALGGAYILERELVGGGMSRVFVGTETSLGRPVAVKVLPPERATRDPIERFKREAEFGARLNHPHIVPVYAFGEFDDIRYFTMPLIAGDTLHDRLALNGRLSAEDACRVLREIGSALAYAHGCGVVHRDVKPENIFIERSTGRALLADFGVALAAGARGDLTLAGFTVGTPAYMSPEQVDAGDIDGRSDVYSLGLVGWEMLSGRRPWSGADESVYEIMHRQKYETLQPLTDFGIDAPRQLVEAIERAMQKDRRQRWPTADAFVLGLGLGARRQRPEARGWRSELQGSRVRGQGPELQRGEEREAEFERPETLVETLDMRAARDSRVQDDQVLWDEELAAVWGHGARRSRRGRYAAAVLLIAGGAAIVGAATVGRGTLVRRFTSAGTIAPLLATAGATRNTLDTRINTMSTRDAAAGLVAMEGRATAPTLVSAVPARPARRVEQVVVHRPRSAERRRLASSGEPALRRIATALVSLEEYERVSAGALPATRAGAESAAALLPSSPSVPPSLPQPLAPPLSQPLSPSLSEPLPPSPSKPLPPSTAVASAPIPVAPVELPVESPVESPVAPTVAAVAVRVPRAKAAVADSAPVVSCGVTVSGRQTCRVLDRRTGRFRDY